MPYRSIFTICSNNRSRQHRGLRSAPSGRTRELRGIGCKYGPTLRDDGRHTSDVGDSREPAQLLRKVKFKVPPAGTYNRIEPSEKGNAELLLNRMNCVM